MTETYDSRKLLKWMTATLLGVVVLAIVLPYAAGYDSHRKSILSILLIHWLAPDLTTWQYGILVPFAVAWLLWQRRERLESTGVRGSSAGLVLMMLALASYYVGYKASNYYFGFLGVQLFIASSVIWVLGFKQMKAMFFPWLVLGTMWPLVFLEDRLGFPLRMLSHDGVMAVVNLLKLPIIAQGSALLSATPGAEIGSWMTLQVEGKCSGMNTLFALMFAALLFSHHVQPTFARRALLFACSIPLAILGNMLRIAILVAGCAIFGQEFAVGDEQREMSGFHLLAGLAVFVFAFAGLQWISGMITTYVEGDRTGRVRVVKIGEPKGLPAKS